MKTQKQMFYSASHHAAKEMLANSIEKLNRERSSLVQAWRDAGNTDDAWIAVTKIDDVIDKQEKILMEM